MCVEPVRCQPHSGAIVASHWRAAGCSRVSTMLCAKVPPGLAADEEGATHDAPMAEAPSRVRYNGPVCSRADMQYSNKHIVMHS